MEEKLSDILKDNKSLQASVDDLNKVCMYITLNLIKFYWISLVLFLRNTNLQIWRNLQCKKSTTITIYWKMIWILHHKINIENLQCNWIYVLSRIWDVVIFRIFSVFVNLFKLSEIKNGLKSRKWSFWTLLSGIESWLILYFYWMWNNKRKI